MTRKNQSNDPVKLFTMKVKSSKLDRYKLMAEERGVSLSKLIQHLLDGQPLVSIRKRKRRSAPKVDPELIFQIAAIGNNLNQIARRCNRQKSVDRQTLLALVEIEKRLKELIDAHQVP